MKFGWLWVLAPAVLTVAAVARVNADTPDPITVPPGADGVTQAWAELGMPEDWAAWGRWVALGESGWSITAQLGKPSDARKIAKAERAASFKAYERLAAQGRWPCPPVDGVTFPGSGGWYGQLASLTTVFLAEKYGAPMREWYCDAVSVWRNPRISTLAHIAQVRGTVQIARNKLGRAPTWLELRALYGLPSRDVHALDTPERRATYEKSSAKAGNPPGWLDRSVPSLPMPSLGMESATNENEAEAASLDAILVGIVELQHANREDAAA